MLITFEGIDGCGKTTQLLRVARRRELYRNDEAPLTTREPGDWSEGEAIRALLLQGKLEHAWSELFLFLVDRCEHVTQTLRPALEGGRVVLCDRYIDSTLAYQVWGRGLPLDAVETLFAWCAFPLPDLTIWLDLSPAKASERLLSRGCPDRIEGADGGFLDRVAVGYETLWKKAPGRIRRVDASCDEDGVASQVWELIAEAVAYR